MEHIIGDCCPNGVPSLAQAFTGTLERIERRYQHWTSTDAVPNLPDRGGQNVIKRIKPSDFSRFYQKSGVAAKIVRQAIKSKDEAESANLSRRILGASYPMLASPKGFTPRDQSSQLKGGRFG